MQIQNVQILVLDQDYKAGSVFTITDGRLSLLTSTVQTIPETPLETPSNVSIPSIEESTDKRAYGKRKPRSNTTQSNTGPTSRYKMIPVIMKAREQMEPGKWYNMQAFGQACGYDTKSVEYKALSGKLMYLAKQGFLATHKIHSHAVLYSWKR